MIPNSVIRGVLYFALVVLTAVRSFSYTDETTPILEWEPNPEPTIAGYNVYIGSSSRNYSQVIDVGLETSIPLTNLIQGITAYLAVTAYDADRLESPFSDEVFYTPPVDGVTAMALPCKMALADGLIWLEVACLTAQQCRIAASSDLEHWEEVYFTATAPGTLRLVAAGKPIRFYRAIVTLQ